MADAGQTPNDPYRVLGVARTSSPEEIRRAYRLAIRRVHPDVGGDAEAATRLTDAYRLLMDPERRARWDRESAPPVVRQPPARPAPPPRGSLFTPSPQGRRFPWLFAACSVVGLMLLIGLVGGGDRKPSPYAIGAGACVDTDGTVVSAVPCASGRADGRVTTVLNLGGGPGASCGDGQHLHPIGEGRALCLEPVPTFEVGGCVSITGTDVAPVPCGANPQGVVNGLASAPDDCPLGTDQVAVTGEGVHVCLVIPGG